MNQSESTIGAGDLLAKEGAIITFVPRDASLGVRYTHEYPGRRTILMRVALQQGESVRLANDRSSKALSWTIYLTESATFNELAEREGALGFMSHHEERKSLDGFSPESGNISAALNTETFSTLLHAIQCGRLPNEIHVRVRGVSYDWQPDGAGKIWDVEKTPHGFVMEIIFNVALITPREDPLDPLDEVARTEGLPATAGDIRSLERKLVASVSDLRRWILNRWIVLFVLIGVGIVLLYSRR